MIVFRVDGDHEIGLGHIYRCLSLGVALHQCDDISFALLETSCSAFEIIRNEGFEVKVYGSNEEFITKLEAKSVVVLDGYRFSYEMLEQVLLKVHSALVIDDFQLSIPRGFRILNQAPHAGVSEYEGHDPSNLFLGLNYLLLRSPFYSIPIRSRALSTKELFICFGGADPSNFTQRVVESLDSDFRAWKLNMIVGVNYKYVGSLRSALNESGQPFQIHINLNAQQMVEQIDRSSMAVVSASGIMLEVISRQRPVVAVRTAENQAALLSGAVEKGLVFGIENFSKSVLLEELNRLHDQRSSGVLIEAQSKALDGKAPNRLREILCHAI